MGGRASATGAGEGDAAPLHPYHLAGGRWGKQASGVSCHVWGRCFDWDSPASHLFLPC
eukprot:SAG25_NODE_33_length_20262_cov_33.203293_18_plen_58_part_00